MRHKLYKACSKFIKEIKLEGTTEIDCSYTKINLKDTKPKNMPRKSKKRGDTSTYSGISHHKVCIIVGIDENDNHFMKVSGIGPESFEKFIKYTNTYKKSNLLIFDSKVCIQQFANYLKITNDIIKTVPEGKNYTTENGNNIQSLNEFCKCITDIIHRYHGVSIRHLNGYLAFQSFKKMFHYKYERKDIVSNMVKTLNNYKTIISKNICSSPIPVDLKEAYWENNYAIFKH